MTTTRTFLRSAREALQAPDDRVGRYVVLGPLGSGGMGTVYRAWDPTLQRDVALKVIGAATAEERARFRREATLEAALNHPNIVPVYEIGESRGLCYIAMALVEGTSLADAEVDVPRAAALVAQASRAVHAAHERGILHRDLKPANLLLDREGRLFVADFGVARRAGDPPLSTPGMVVGTPAFMAPEQERGGEIDARSDVYALGATLYALAARALPKEEPAFPRGVPAELRWIIRQATAPEPGERYASAAELADDLERFLRGEPIRARRDTSWRRLRRWVRRNPSAWALGMVLALAVTAGAWFIRGQRHELARLERFWNSEKLPRQYDETRARLEPILQRADECFFDGRAADADDLVARMEEELAKLEEHWRRTSLPDAYRGWLLVNVGRAEEGERLLIAAADPARLERGDPYGAVFLARWRARKLSRTKDPAEAAKLRADVAALLEWKGWSEARESGRYRAFLVWLAGGPADAALRDDPVFGRDVRELARP